MIAVVILAVAAVNVFFLSGATRRSMTRIERAAVALAPAPLIVSIVLPAILAWSSGFSAAGAKERAALTIAGLVLSGLLTTACALIGVRLRRKTGAVSAAAAVATVIASVPLVLYVLALLLWAVGGMVTGR